MMFIFIGLETAGFVVIGNVVDIFNPVIGGDYNISTLSITQFHDNE